MSTIVDDVASASDRTPRPAPISRPVGATTRGTTAPNRLRRVDTWLIAEYGHVIKLDPDPLVIDLGFGASPVTTVELRSRLLAAGCAPRVVGLEIDPERVSAARARVDPPGLDFRRGGFELAGLDPLVVRAMNVLRQYEEPAVAGAWRSMTQRLAPGGVVIEGTCDEEGLVGAWIALDRSGPRSLTLAANLRRLTAPHALAERLPKALIHRNVPGEGIHDLLATLDRAWRAAAVIAAYGPARRWQRAVAVTRAAGWPIIGGPARWRRGEISVHWSAVAPR